MHHSVPQCDRCRTSAVTTQRDAELAFASVIDWLESHVGPSRLREVKLEYGSISPTGNNMQMLGHTHFAYRNDLTSLTIKTAPELPLHVLSSTLAHELGHVLLFVDHRTLLKNDTWPDDDHITEGFCEVVASQWLESQTDALSRIFRQHMDTNTTPVYGDGFRLMYPEYERAGSLIALREILVTRGTKYRSTPSSVAPKSKSAPSDTPVTDSAISTHRPVIDIRPIKPAAAPAVRSEANPRQGRPIIPMKRRRP